MIDVLRIRNLAIIEELELELRPGLNVVTGQTGAGKSMLVAALELLRGGRAGAHMVRTGATSATVEAQLDDGTVVRRVVTTGGRSRAYLNGDLCTLLELKERRWLDISSQHEHHALADPAGHLSWLDRFAGVDTEAMGESLVKARSARGAWTDFRDRDTDRVDLLRFQAAEIERVAPTPGELDAVLAELTVAENAVELRELVGRAERAGVADALVALRAAARLDGTLAGWVQRLEAVELELDDLVEEFGAYAGKLDVDPGRLMALRERETGLSRLVRRHGDLQTALARLATLQHEISAEEDAELTLDRLAAEASEALEAAAEEAQRLSTVRSERAAALSEAVSTELSALGMGDARISVTVDSVPAGQGDLAWEGARLGLHGLDRVEFLIAPNPGELPRPLARIASGGELSRALLALKQVLAALGPVGTYVFDEVDTGVGGAVAEAIGRKLHGVAKHHQVLCVTHQAVVASWADAHHRVEKAVDKGRTRTSVRLLSAAEREEELARMLGGEKVTAGVRQAAADLLGARL